MEWASWSLDRVLILFVSLAFLMIGIQVTLYHYRQNFHHAAMFDQLEGARQSEILERLSEGKLQLSPEWTALKQKGLFKKLLGTAIDAYCSHPDIWSEIGYAGPAYPRGYVRGDIGQLDPWEAKTEA